MVAFRMLTLLHDTIIRFKNEPTYEFGAMASVVYPAGEAVDCSICHSKSNVLLKKSVIR